MDKGNSKLPVFYISGSCAYEIGFNYGSILANKISECYNIYEKRFYDIFELATNTTGADKNTVYNWIRKCSLEYVQLLVKYKHILGDVIDELKGISDGSKMELWKIYCINVRGELFGLLLDRYNLSSADCIDFNECTTILSKQNGVLSQNWDWIKDMEANVIILNINNEILTMVEAGLIAKVGFNKHGLGCTINSLAGVRNYLGDDIDTGEINGIPIHMIMQHLLSKYKSVKEIENSDIVSRLPVNRFIGIGILDNNCNGYFLEYCGLNTFDKLSLSNTRFSFHTNHYLGCGFSMVANEITAANPGSYFRLKKLKRLYSNYETICANEPIQTCKLLLTNNETDLHSHFPIFRSWTQSKYKGYVGTICTIVMDLNRRIMHISREKDANLTDTSNTKVKFDKIHLATNYQTLNIIDNLLQTIKML